MSEFRELVVPAEAFVAWQELAASQREDAGEWRDYAGLLTAFAQALRRAPLSREACEQAEIERLLIEELVQLADAVQAVFPQGGFEEFRSYMSAAARDRESRAWEGRA